MPREKREAILSAGVDDPVIATVLEVVAVLHRDDSRQPSCLGELRGVNIRNADVANLARLPELNEGTDRVRQRDPRIDCVELVEIDAVELEPPQAALAWRRNRACELGDRRRYRLRS
jgi:hypothetical protein